MAFQPSQIEARCPECEVTYAPSIGHPLRGRACPRCGADLEVHRLKRSRVPAHCGACADMMLVGDGILEGRPYCCIRCGSAVIPEWGQEEPGAPQEPLAPPPPPPEEQAPAAGDLARWSTDEWPIVAPAEVPPGLKPAAAQQPVMELVVPPKTSSLWEGSAAPSNGAEESPAPVQAEKAPPGLSRRGPTAGDPPQPEPRGPTTISIELGPTIQRAPRGSESNGAIEPVASPEPEPEPEARAPDSGPSVERDPSAVQEARLDARPSPARSVTPREEQPVTSDQRRPSSRRRWLPTPIVFVVGAWVGFALGNAATKLLTREKGPPAVAPDTSPVALLESPDAGAAPTPEPPIVLPASAPDASVLVVPRVARGTAAEPSRPEELVSDPRIEAARHERRGRQQLEQGELDRAVASFRRAITIDPAAGTAWRGLGAALSARGELREAARCYQRYLQLSPGARDAREVRELIEKLR